MISVVMSIYNEPREWIEEAIDSILAQTYTEFEFIIIVDNPGLRDDVLSFLQQKEKSDGRIRLIKNERNIGLAMSLNKGISIAVGEYIARMDADDVSFPERLEKEIAFLEAQNADMVSTNCEIIDENSAFVRMGAPKKTDPSGELPYSNMILHPSVLMRKETFESAGGYRNFRRSQDYDLWLRMLSDNSIIRILNEPLMKYRVNRNSLTQTNRLEQYYANLYQRKLYNERRKTGYDSFSEQNLANFLMAKHITVRKNTRCLKCMKALDSAKLHKNCKNPVFVFEMLKAVLIFPSIGLRAVLQYCKRLLKGKK